MNRKKMSRKRTMTKLNSPLIDLERQVLFPIRSEEEERRGSEEGGLKSKLKERDLLSK